MLRTARPEPLPLTTPATVPADVQPALGSRAPVELPTVLYQTYFNDKVSLWRTGCRTVDTCTQTTHC